ncbi:MAG TPA: signal peptidase I [Pyrinomonadaceae bacterium]|nr:signal peptidase I [Pyrinomonadaceae bacterium]
MNDKESKQDDPAVTELKDADKAKQAKSQQIPKGPPRSVAREYFESLVVTLIMALFGMTFVIQAVTVPTGSMQNTILVGDYLIVNKFIFNPNDGGLPFLPMREIRRGDIIVFKYPGNAADPNYDRIHGYTPYQLNYVKRVIGLPGERVEFKNNRVYINGELLPEHRLIGDSSDNLSPLKTREFESRKPEDKWDVYYSSFTMEMALAGQEVPTARWNFCVPGKPMIVPENSYFVMGDSRDQSDDGRQWGFVPRELVIGRAMFVYWSCDRAAAEDSMLGCLTHPRLRRIGHLVR